MNVLHEEPETMFLPGGFVMKSCLVFCHEKQFQLTMEVYIIHYRQPDLSSQPEVANEILLA